MNAHVRYWTFTYISQFMILQLRSLRSLFLEQIRNACSLVFPLAFKIRCKWNISNVLSQSISVLILFRCVQARSKTACSMTWKENSLSFTEYNVECNGKKTHMNSWFCLQCGRHWLWRACCFYFYRKKWHFNKKLIPRTRTLSSTI